MLCRPPLRGISADDGTQKPWFMPTHAGSRCPEALHRCPTTLETWSMSDMEGVRVVWHGTGAGAIRTGEFIQNRLESLQRHQQQLQAANHHQVGLESDNA